mgnify:CR=1 FL=1
MLIVASLALFELMKVETKVEPKNFIEMKVAGIELKDDYAIVRLRNGCKELEFFVSSSQGKAIEDARKGIKHKRPSTHDLLASTLEELGIRIIDVRITELRRGIYYARLRVKDLLGVEHELDCRPSDCIVLALKSGSKILVARNLTRDTCAGLM